MGKPSAPDPTATAQAQTSSNIATANANANLNRVDQYSPLGSSTYQVTGTNADGTPKYTQTTSLSAPIQGIFNSQVANQQNQQNISSQLLGNVASQYSKPIDVSGVNSLNSGMSADQLAALNSRYATSAGAGQTSSAGQAQADQAQAAQVGAAQANAAQAQAVQSALGQYVTSAGDGGGSIQRGLNIGSVPGLIQGAQNAAYANQMAYLTPQFTNDQSDLNSKLAAQGITQGSDAWNRAQSELSRNQTFQQQQAQNAAFNQGITAGNTAFGMDLQSGQFANAAQQQGYDQAASNAGLANTAAAAATQNNQFNAGQGTQVSLANADRNTQNSQFNAGQLNQVAQANADRATNVSQFNAGQNTQTSQFNAGQQTQNNQFNASQLQQAAQYNAGLNNSTVNSQYGNSVTNANLNNAANAQGMTNAFSVYNQPLNTYNQLQTGAQASMPTFSSVPTASVAPTDVAGIINNGYANQVGAYNGTMQGLGMLGAGYLGYLGSKK